MLELFIALFLIALNGLFSLSELAVVSARKLRLKTMADSGRPGARAALELAEDPGRFLSTVQIGITLIGILAGAFSGAALGERMTDLVAQAGVAHWIAEALGYGLVISAITYLSVVIGELVPKHLALRNAEGIACAVAPLMAFLSRIASPVVLLLDASTKFVFRLVGGSTEPASAVTEEEIKTIVAEAETAGVIETDERRMISGVLRLGDRAVRGVMTPRTDVDWIDLEHEAGAIRDRLIRHRKIPARPPRRPSCDGRSAITVHDEHRAIIGQIHEDAFTATLETEAFGMGRQLDVGEFAIILGIEDRERAVAVAHEHTLLVRLDAHVVCVIPELDRLPFLEARAMKDPQRPVPAARDVEGVRRAHIADPLRFSKSLQPLQSPLCSQLDHTHGPVAELRHEQTLPGKIHCHVIDSPADLAERDLCFEAKRRRFLTTCRCDGDGAERNQDRAYPSRQ